MPFCASCGAEVQGSFCPSCGKPVAAAPGAAPGAVPAGVPPPAASAGLQENMANALCYLLGLITGVLFLVLEPYNRNRNVRFHAFQSIFLHVGVIALWIVLLIMGMILGPLSILLSLFSMVLWLGCFVLWIVLLVKTYNGAKIVLPIIGPLAEKQAGA